MFDKDNTQNNIVKDTGKYNQKFPLYSLLKWFEEVFLME